MRPLVRVDDLVDQFVEARAVTLVEADRELGVIGRGRGVCGSSSHLILRFGGDGQRHITTASRKVPACAYGAPARRGASVSDRQDGTYSACVKLIQDQLKRNRRAFV